MDILLIYPAYSLKERYGRRSVGNVGGILPPLGLASLAAYVRQNGFSAGIIDSLAEGLSDEEIVVSVQKADPKVIGLSAISSCFPVAARLSAKLRSAFSDKLIILGGHHASILPEDVLDKHEDIDICVCGEGEQTLKKLLEACSLKGWDRRKVLSDSRALRDIDGIAFRGARGYVKNNPVALVENIDTLPYPAWDLLPMEKYSVLPNQYRRQPLMHLIASRGCPYGCSFCSYNAVFGRKLRQLSSARVVETLKYLVQKHKVKEVSFWDDTFTARRDWVFSLCREIKAAKLGLLWSCYARVDNIDRELLRGMKEAGCWNIFYGLESGNQELLDFIDKGIRLDDIRKAVLLTKEAGIEVRASFMLGLPGETPEKARKTIDFAVSIDPDYAQFSLTTPFPKTRLHEESPRFGHIRGGYEEYNGWIPVFIPYGYRSADELIQMEKEAMRRFYLRFSYIWGRLMKIRSWQDIIRYLKGLRMLWGFVR